MRGHLQRVSRLSRTCRAADKMDQVVVHGRGAKSLVEGRAPGGYPGDSPGPWVKGNLELCSQFFVGGARIPLATRLPWAP